MRIPCKHERLVIVHSSITQPITPPVALHNRQGSCQQLERPSYREAPPPEQTRKSCISNKIPYHLSIARHTCSMGGSSSTATSSGWTAEEGWMKDNSVHSFNYTLRKQYWKSHLHSTSCAKRISYRGRTFCAGIKEVSSHCDANGYECDDGNNNRQ